MATLITKNSSTASAAPLAADLTQGELAVNVTDKKLYSKDSGGAVVKLVGGLGNQEANAVAITGGTINGATVGATTASTGAFTTLSASSTVSGTGFSTYLASPPAIGGTAAAAVSATTLAASGAVTLSGGTANGVTYLNGSKVLTSGSALTFDGNTLTAINTSGNAIIASRGSKDLRLSGNYAGANTHAVISTTTGMALAFMDESNEYMRLTSTGLGIGTSSPSQKLQVKGIVNFEAISGSTNVWQQYTYSDNTLRWNYNGAGNDEVVLDSSGNLGLGVTPSAWGSSFKAFQVGVAGCVASQTSAKTIEIANNAYNNSGWKYQATDVATLYYQYNGQHVWQTAPSGTAGNAISFTQALTLDASGNLLLGGTTGSSRLVVQGPQGGELYINYNGTSTNYYNAGTHIFQAASGLSERARIDSSGNLLVGTTSASAGNTFGSGVLARSTSKPLAAVCDASSGSSSMGIGRTTSTGNYVEFYYGSALTTSTGTISTNGTTTAYNTTSDQRLKENIVDADSASSLIDSLQVRQFDWKADGSHQRYGFVAQELVTVAPEAVHQPEDTEQMMAVDYSKLVPMLVKEIQSLRQRLAAANL